MIIYHLHLGGTTRQLRAAAEGQEGWFGFIICPEFTKPTKDGLLFF